MWMIVFYHFHVHVLSVYSSWPFFEAIQIPFHISVPVFVLISGYFGIHYTTKGFCKLITQIGFYSLSILLISFFLNLFFTSPYPITRHQIVDGICFISRTNNLWFIRTYVLLYLLSPFWNKVLNGQNVQQRIVLLIVLAFMVLYMSNVGQISGLDGKSVISFLFVYTIGHTIREYKLNELISVKSLLSSFLIINIFFVVLYVIGNDNVLLRVGIKTLAFKYNSPFCILSASIFFVLFTKINIVSNMVNRIAISIFAIYLISENSLVNVYLNDIVRYLQVSFSIVPMYLLLILFTTLIMIVCICIDRVTLGVQRFLSAGLNKIICNLADKSKKLIVKL